MTKKLKVTYDYGKPPEELSIADVLTWREWSVHEVEAITKVSTGDLRRFSTSRDGVPCDLEAAS